MTSMEKMNTENFNLELEILNHNKANKQNH